MHAVTAERSSNLRVAARDFTARWNPGICAKITHTVADKLLRIGRRKPVVTSRDANVHEASIAIFFAHYGENFAKRKNRLYQRKTFSRTVQEILVRDSSRVAGLGSSELDEHYIDPIQTSIGMYRKIAKPI